MERVAAWPEEDVEKLDQALRQIEEWQSQKERL